MSTIPIIASAEDLPGAVRHATREPGARWYVAKRASVLGNPEAIPDEWGITAAFGGDWTPPGKDDKGKKTGGKIETKEDFDAAVKAFPFAKDKAAEKKRLEAAAEKLGIKVPKSITASSATALPGSQASGRMDGMTAAGWNANLHPRDRKGRYIEKFDLVSVFNTDGSPDPAFRGKVVGNGRTSSGDDYLEVRALGPDGEPTGTSHQIPAAQVESAPDPKARLDTPAADPAEAKFQADLAAEPSQYGPAPEGVDQHAWDVANDHSMDGWDLSGEDRDYAQSIAEDEGVDFEDLLKAAENIDMGGPGDSPAGGADPGVEGGTEDSAAAYLANVGIDRAEFDRLVKDADLSPGPDETWDDVTGSIYAEAIVNRLPDNISDGQDDLIDNTISSAFDNFIGDHPASVDSVASGLMDHLDTDGPDLDENGNPITTVSFDGSAGDLKQYRDETEARLVENGVDPADVPAIEDEIGHYYETETDPIEAADAIASEHGPDDLQSAIDAIPDMSTHELQGEYDAVTAPDFTGSEDYANAVVDAATQAGLLDGGGDGSDVGSGTLHHSDEGVTLSDKAFEDMVPVANLLNVDSADGAWASGTNEWQFDNLRNAYDDYAEDREAVGEFEAEKLDGVKEYADKHGIDDPTDVIDFRKQAMQLGWSQEEQLANILNGQPLDEQNRGALENIEDFLRNNPLTYHEFGGEGAGNHTMQELAGDIHEYLNGAFDGEPGGDEMQVLPPDHPEVNVVTPGEDNPEPVDPNSVIGEHPSADEELDNVLQERGELYRNADGNEVWRIKDKDGNVVQDNIASDHDAAFIAQEQVDSEAKADAAPAPAPASPAASAGDPEAAAKLRLMAQSAAKTQSPDYTGERIGVGEMQAEIDHLLEKAKTDPIGAHQGLAKHMTRLKLGGKQRKRYRELLDAHIGGSGDDSGSTEAATTAANLSDSNPVKERLAAKAAEKAPAAPTTPDVVDLDAAADQLYNSQTGAKSSALPKGVKKVKTEPVKVEFISSKFRSNAKTASEIQVNGESIGTVQPGKVGGNISAKGGSYTVGWAAESSGWLAFDEKGKEVRGVGLTAGSASEAISLLLKHKADRDRKAKPAAPVPKKKFAQQSKVTVDGEPGYVVVGESMDPGFTVVAKGSNLGAKSKVPNSSLAADTAPAAPAVDPNMGLTDIPGLSEGDLGAAIKAEQDRLFKETGKYGQESPRLKALRNEQNRRYRADLLAGNGPSETVETPGGPIRAGDVITYESRGDGQLRMLVDHVSEDVKNGEPGFGGVIVDLHNNPVLEMGHERQHWGYADQASSVIRKAPTGKA